jgi:hypothetical protein
MVGSVLIGKLITRDMVVRLARAAGMRMTATQAAKYVPLAGQAAAAALGYATLRYLGERHIQDCIRVVEQAELDIPSHLPTQLEHGPQGRADRQALHEHGKSKGEGEPEGRAIRQAPALLAPAGPRPLGPLPVNGDQPRSEARWRSGTWVASSPQVRLTRRPHATAGRWAISRAQRITCVYSWAARNSAAPYLVEHQCAIPGPDGDVGNAVVLSRDEGVLGQRRLSVQLARFPW